MSDRWPLRKIGDCVDQRREFVTLQPGIDYTTLGVRWYGKGAYNRGIGTTETIKAKRLFRARAGDLIFNRIDTQKGAFDVVPERLDGALVTNEFPLYVARAGDVLPLFLLHHFQQQSVLDGIGGSRAGSEGRARWKEADFEAHTLRVPTVREQLRIVDVMTALDTQIESLEAEAAAAGCYFRLLVQTLTAPDETAVPLTEVADNLDNRRVPVSAVERAGRQGSVPYFGAAGRTGWIDKPLFDEPLVCLGEDGAGLLNWATKAIAYKIDGPSWVNNHAHVLRATKVTTTWLALTLMHYDISNLVNEGTRPKLNKGVLDRLLVRVGDTHVDELMATSARDCYEALTVELESLRAFRASLLTCLLNQSIPIPASYDAVMEVAS